MIKKLNSEREKRINDICNDAMKIVMYKPKPIDDRCEEIRDSSPIESNGQYFISNGRIMEAGRKNKYPYFGESDAMIVLFSAKNEGTIISNEDNFDIGVFVDSLDESQFVRLEKGTMLEITI